MELFSDGGNSPRQIYDFFGTMLRRDNSHEETTYGKPTSFFDDPEWRKQSHSDLAKEDFILDINQNDVADFQVFDVSKKIKKTRKKPDYKKNICGYITKRIIREFLGKTYKKQVSAMCGEFKCKINLLKDYFLARIESITGPRHLDALLSPSGDAKQMAIKKTFLKFFEWFLKEKYVRYLLIDGKMANKRLYIEYKNTTIAKIVRLAKARYQ